MKTYLRTHLNTLFHSILRDYIITGWEKLGLYGYLFLCLTNYGRNDIIKTREVVILEG